MLLGTQMVAKGHHFAGVELAAVVDADTGLGAARLPRRGAHVPADHAARRAAAAATRRAACSSRRSSPTRARSRYAARHDVARFLAEELERRRALGYPPFAHLVRIVVTGPRARAGRARARGAEGRHPGAELLGPAPLLRLRGKHRAQLVAKTDAAARGSRRRPRACSPPPRPRCAAPADRRRRRRSADALTWRPGRRESAGARQEIIGEWGIRDVTPPSRGRARARSSSSAELNPLDGHSRSRGASARFRPEADRYVASLGGPLPVHAAAAADRGRDRAR